MYKIECPHCGVPLSLIAEGLATCLNRACAVSPYQLAPVLGSPSKPAETGDAPAPEQPANDPSDDQARPEIAPRRSSPANTRQFGGDHYKGVGYEHWDFVHDTNMDYWQGCATKYITRGRKHMAGFVLNIEKAMHYVDKREELAAEGRQNNAVMPEMDRFRDYVAANQLNEAEADAILDIIAGRWGEARAVLQGMLPEADQTPREQ